MLALAGNYEKTRQRSLPCLHHRKLHDRLQGISMALLRRPLQLIATICIILKLTLVVVWVADQHQAHQRQSLMRQCEGDAIGCRGGAKYPCQCAGKATPVLEPSPPRLAYLLCSCVLLVRSRQASSHRYRMCIIVQTRALLARSLGKADTSKLPGHSS